MKKNMPFNDLAAAKPILGKWMLDVESSLAGDVAGLSFWAFGFFAIEAFWSDQRRNSSFGKSVVPTAAVACSFGAVLAQSQPTAGCNRRWLRAGKAAG